ncbi:MAG TPA: fibronectin type III domain-containing protein [Acidimicrobiales bacterium]|nr:fibronectin type III domain-containing protein [Acidimicrobiales bacterium]
MDIWRRGWLTVGLAVATMVVLPMAAGAQGNHYGSGDYFGQFSGPGYSVHHGGNGESDVNVCAQNQRAGTAACDARVVTQPASTASGSASPGSLATWSCPANDTNAPPAVIGGGNGGYDPCYLQSAYNAATLAQNNGGRGEIVAIVDYSVDPNIASDLAAYRSMWSLPSCPSGPASASNTGCVFDQVAQLGAPTSGNSGWDVEISLDVDTVSAICPNCQILLIEANSTSFSSLGSAVNTAVADGAIAVSNSYGGTDSSGESTIASAYYQHPGVAVTVSSGDSAGVVEFPSSAPDVVAVGGTSLLQYSNQGSRSANATETVWNGTPSPGDGTGAGCSHYESSPSWQSAFISAAGGSSTCSTRVTADVSADADPDTGLWVYDTYSQGGWLIVGGTSLASPLVAALYGLSNNATGSSVYPASDLYADSSSFYHVTSGNVGSCGTYLCDATKAIDGFSGPGGVGTPGGSGALSAFAYNPSSSPTPPATPGAPSIGTVTTTSVALSWAADSGATSYTVYDGTSPGSLSPVVSGLGSTSYTVTGLSPSTTYYFALTASNSAGTSSQSTTSSTTTNSLSPPSAPTGLGATPGNGSVSLSWTAPTNNGGSAITGYVVYYATTSGGELTGSSQAAASTSATVTGLANGTTYYFEVEAKNAQGNSGVSNEASATPATTPSAPTLNSATPGAGQVALGWSAPTNNGGSAITGYVVYDGTSSPPTTKVGTFSATTTSTTVTDLTGGTQYYFDVVATNAVGSSPASNALAATPTGAAPSVPTNLRAKARFGSVNVSWSASSGSSPITYTVYYSTTNSFSGATKWGTTSGTSVSISGLRSSTTYFFWVVASNSVGSSAPAGPVSSRG